MSIKLRVATIITSVVLSGAAAFAPLAAGAQTTADIIAQLQAQIAALTAQLAALSGSSSTPATGGSCSFTRDLSRGVRGDDVKCLQGYLNVTPQSGFFGPLTQAAVSKWQRDNGVTPTAGYFGSKSRAKFSSMVVVAPPVLPPGTNPPVVVAAGSGLTVTSPVDQPASTLAPQSAARLAFTKAILTASADGDVTVSSITVERQGLANDAAFSSIVLLDEDGSQIGNSRTLSSDHKVALTESFVVKAGTSKTVTVAANMASALSDYAGQVAKLAIVAVNAGTSKVNASFPISSNGMTINSTLSIGSVTMAIGSLDPGAANTKNVGTKGYYLASVKASIGSAEDVTFERIRFNQSGSAAASDLANVMVNVAGKEYPATVSSDGKYFAISFTDGVVITKGNSVEFSIKADLVNGSARTVDMDILRKTDIVVKGKTYGYYITAGGGSSGAASAGAFSTNQEPYFNAYAATIDKGSVAVSSSNSVTSGNVPTSVTDTVLGAFTFDTKGEPVQFSAITLNFTFTGTGTSSDITSVKLYDSNGNIVAGPKDPASGVVAWTDTWTAPVGAKVYTVKGKLGTTFVTNDSVTVGMNASNMTSKGEVTGLSISPTPASTLVNANSQTVRSAALAISVSATPFAQNVVRNVNGFHFATYVFDGTQSGEDVRVTNVQLRDTLSATGVADELNTCVLFDGATALNTGSDVVNPDDPSSGTTDDTTFTLTNNLIVPKGAVKKIDLKCNISSSATADSTHAWGTNAGASNVNSVGASTATSITESITTAAGSTMTVKTAGSFSVVKDASAPSSAFALSGKTSVPVNVLKFHATNESIDIREVTLTYSSSTASTSDFTKVSIWDGATKLADAVWAGSAQNATATLDAAVHFVVPKDGDKLMTVTVDLADISVVASSTAGRLLAIDYNGVSSSSAIGQASGSKLGSSSGSNTAGATVQITRSLPYVEKIAVPSTSIPQSPAKLYRFSVKADAAGPVALYKVTFYISSSTVNATSSTFNLYAYKDSGFSQKAYDNNPLYSRAVGCAAASSLDTDTNCVADTTGSATASSTVATSTQVVFFFNPSSYTASTTEAIFIPAGETRYFELQGNITLTGAGTGNSVSVFLAGDSARPVQYTDVTALHNLGLHRWLNNYGQGFLATGAAIAAGQDFTRNKFVWSPMSTTTNLTGATSTQDWTNGFLVPGLPSTGLSSNVFTN